MKIRPALKITLIYAVFGLAWILFTDRIVTTFLKDIGTIDIVMTAKGWAYVAVTALLVYILVDRQVKRETDLRDTLRESRAMYRMIVETTREGVVIIDPEGWITFANPRISQLLDIPVNEIEGLSFVMLIAEEDRERARRCFEESRDASVEPMEYYLPVRNRTILTVQICFTSIRSPSGNFSGCLATILDVSELKRKENDLIRSMGEREILLREVHHRVKNSLQLVASLLNLHIDKVPDPRVVDLMRRGQVRVQSMALVYEHLYSSSDFTRINVAEYLNDLLKNIMVSFQGGLRGVNLVVDSAGIELDIDRVVVLGLIVDELVVNALTHAFPAGSDSTERREIRVRFIPAEDVCTLEVSDNGRGFSGSPDSLHGGLGFELIESLVQQLEGSFEIRGDAGFLFSIKFRLDNAL
jgi:two-component system, sensor histidine kinase PdtaS